MLQTNAVGQYLTVFRFSLFLFTAGQKGTHKSAVEQGMILISPGKGLGLGVEIGEGMNLGHSCSPGCEFRKTCSVLTLTHRNGKRR
jgi:hypothetical protein